MAWPLPALPPLVPFLPNSIPFIWFTLSILGMRTLSSFQSWMLGFQTELASRPLSMQNIMRYALYLPETTCLSGIKFQALTSLTGFVSRGKQIWETHRSEKQRLCVNSAMQRVKVRMCRRCCEVSCKAWALLALLSNVNCSRMCCCVHTWAAVCRMRHACIYHYSCMAHQDASWDCWASCGAGVLSTNAAWRQQYSCQCCMDRSCVNTHVDVLCHMT